jgi:hypothetical protein
MGMRIVSMCMRSASFSAPEAAAKAPTPIKSLTPLSAIKALQTPCRTAKKNADQLMNLTFTSNSFGRETSTAARESSAGFCVCSVICQVAGSSLDFELQRLAHYCGQAAPPSIQIFICAIVSACESGGGARPSPGSHAQPTRSSEDTCSRSCRRVRLPVCLTSLSWRQSCAGGRPTKTILWSGDGRDHLGFPGGMWSPERLADWWQVLQRIP